MLVCNRAYCGQIGYKRIDPTIPPERYKKRRRDAGYAGH
jgi:hypothetical protein